MAEAPLHQLLSEHFGPEAAAWGPQRKLYACLSANKSAARPWGAPCGLTFTGCSLSFCHISLCFYSMSLSPGEERRRAFADQRQGVGGCGGEYEPLKWIQIRWSTCHRTGQAVFEGLTPGFCMLQRAGLRSGKAVNSNSGRRVARGRAHPFVYCLLYAPLYYAAVCRRLRRSSEELLVLFHPQVWHKRTFDQINFKQKQRLGCSRLLQIWILDHDLSDI